MRIIVVDCLTKQERVLELDGEWHFHKGAYLNHVTRKGFTHYFDKAGRYDGWGRDVDPREGIGDTGGPGGDGVCG